MRHKIHVVLIFLISLLLSCSSPPSKPTGSAFGLTEFETLLEKLALGWNTNNTKLAISVFSNDAIYAEPPAKQLYVGSDEIFNFFGGEKGRSDWMHMMWHNISFNQQKQLGAGEFTFSWEGGQVHGMVSIKVKNGLISRWREYFYESTFKWHEFAKPSKF